MTPNIELNGGTTIPQLGFGTMDVSDRSGSEEAAEITAEAVRQALQVGYRHFDTAQMYVNEAGVGRGIATSGIPRADVHITSKLGNGNHRPDDVRRSFDETLGKLAIDQLDLFLMHWPLPTKYDGDFVSTWQVIVDLKRDDRLRSAGVSNFQPDHLDRIIGETGHVPAVNQIEVHPYFSNDAAREATLSKGIVIEAWSPLGQGAILQDQVIGRIATRHGKTPAQIVLRWHLQHGHVIFPKSAHRERMAENFAIFDFDLTTEDMTAIDGLDQGEEGRIGPNPDNFDWIPA